MGMTAILLSIIMFCLCAAVYMRISYKKERGESVRLDRGRESRKQWNWNDLDQLVRSKMYEWTTDPLLDDYLHEEAYRREYVKRAALRGALRTCGSGDRAQKELIKDYIEDILRASVHWDEQQWNSLIAFDHPELLSVKDQFDLMLYRNTKLYGAGAMAYLIRRYSWDELKAVSSGADEVEYHYVIHREEIEYAFRHERLIFVDEERLRIVAQRIYERFKGLSVIDELRDQQIDGISGGVSGVNTNNAMQTMQRHVGGELAYSHHESDEDHAMAYNSVWMFYQGKSIRLAFLGFGSELELKRVCHNIYKHHAPGPLTEADGYRINDMKDGSRVVVMRPPFAESWAFFVRKFNRDLPTLEQLITAEGSETVRSFLRYLMKGARLTAITGSQGSGKTTLLMAMVQAIYPYHTLRVQEQAFELNLRELYPNRNIVTMRETEHISGQTGLDVQKKTDGSVHILGEVSTDPVAAWMIQMSQVSSLFTVFTHHAKTFPDLILSLRNSLLKTGMFHHERMAEQQVADAIQFNIHLNKDASGHRYIERVTECIPLYYPEHEQAAEKEEMLETEWDSYRQSAVRYYTRQTEPYAFHYRHVVEFIDGRYVWQNSISQQQKDSMLQYMNEEDQLSFHGWLKEQEEADAA